MIFALFGWLILTAAVTFAAYRLTGNNRYYAAVFGILTFFAPPLGVGAFLIFALLVTLKPDIREPVPDTRTETTKRQRRPGIEQNAHYSDRLEAAKAEVEKYCAAALEIESEIAALHADTPDARNVLAALEEKKAKNAVKKIAADEAYDRLRKLRR